ncbi:MAG: DUF4907 domain-containing protein [Parafilimonas sp.]|nr:DUF4907 domain-containing protein [Parafilimonas sp.]
MKTIIAVSVACIFLIQVLFSAEKNCLPQKDVYQPIQDTTVHIFSSHKKGYGFDILIGNKVFIHQPFIPAVQGNQRFATKTDANKTASLMLFKLRKHGMPPTISTAELDSLHIHINK